MDRASDSGSEGWGFESLPAYQKIQTPFGVWIFCCRWDSNHYIPQSGGLWAAPAGGCRTLQFANGKLQRVPSGLPRHRKAQTDGSPGRAGGQCPLTISHSSFLRFVTSPTRPVSAAFRRTYYIFPLPYSLKKPGVVTAVEIGVSILSIKYQPKSRPSAYLPLAPSGTCGASSLPEGAMGCIPFHIGLLQYVKCLL